MKKKSILLILSFCAIVTLSFSFVGESAHKTEEPNAFKEAYTQVESPLGGFALEDELEK